MKIQKIKDIIYIISFFLLLIFFFSCTSSITSVDNVRKIKDFDNNWKFHLGDIENAQEQEFDDSQWRVLNLPHDWSIEGKFSKDNPAGVGGGALPGGIGWYRKTFNLSESDKDKLVFTDFDGVYRNSEVWINGHYLGKRPYGYSSFRYELSPFLKFGSNKNVISVKVDNSQQPNSRWYTGSGIYRNVWLVTTNKIYIEHWGTFVTTPEVSEKSVKVSIKIKIRNKVDKDQKVILKTMVINKDGERITKTELPVLIMKDSVVEINQELNMNNPELWSIESPNLYKAITTIEYDDKILDDFETTFGIRYFRFDAEKGFFLNGNQIKIRGVCNHHDLGCLGAAVNTRAIERQLEILKEMGANGIRTAHNPPTPELLDLCDKMGFIVMDEAFDMWKKGKTKYDYSRDWDAWHKRDLEDMVLRDRNHPSVFMWSIGNEIGEQFDHKDSSGSLITRELVSIVKNLDTTRPVTTNCNDTDPLNPLITSGALDLIGFSYHGEDYKTFPEKFPGEKLIGSETTSALETRGHYDMPSDSIRRWPPRWDLPLETGNPDNTCSSYDNCSAPWGATHEEALNQVNKFDFVSGMYIWTGLDYLGEPTPYGWPSRSSYFGIVDLAGFPKDAYYLYKSEWTDEPVLHIFPHWNWNDGDIVDVWAYTNCDEVDLFLNDNSFGIKKKSENDHHLMWRIKYAPGTLKAVGYKKGKKIITSVVKTAGPPAKIILEVERNKISAGGRDLSFVTVKVLDKNNTMVPYANNLINFKISGEGKIVGVDNGSETSHESFKANFRKAFNGMCLVVVQSSEKAGEITLEASSDALESVSIEIETK